VAPVDAAPTHIESKAPPAEPSRFTLRVGAGFGAGNDGIAASLFGAADVWPWSRWGLGVEGSTGGSSSMALFGPTRSSSLRAGRVRFAGRLRVANGSYFSAALALGLAERVTVRESEVDDGCDDFEEYCPGVGPEPPDTGPSPRTDATVPTGALELAFQGRIAGPVELGLVLRGEVGPEAGLVTFGPLLGVGF